MRLKFFAIKTIVFILKMILEIWVCPLDTSMLYFLKQKLSAAFLAS